MTTVTVTTMRENLMLILRTFHLVEVERLYGLQHSVVIETQLKVRRYPRSRLELLTQHPLCAADSLDQ